MKKNKTTIILAVACVAIVLLAVFLLSSPNNDTPNVPDKPNTENVENTPNDTTKPEDKVENNGGSENTENVIPNAVYKERQDGEKMVPIFHNGVKVGATNLYTHNGSFRVQLKPLNDANVFNFEKQEDGSLVWDGDRLIYTLTENSITIFNKEFENQREDSDNDTINNEVIDESKDAPESATTTINLPAFIYHKDEIYLTESVITLFGNSFASDKGIHIITTFKQNENSEKIETILQENPDSQIDVKDETLKAIAEDLFNNRFVISVESFSGIKENYDNEAIKNVLFNAFNNPDNIIYQNQYNDKQLIVMFDDNTAGALLNTVMETLAISDRFANVRTLVELDDNRKIDKIYIDSYYTFDNRDIYYYITISK